MIDVPVFSQRDPRWGEKYVGFSTLRFKSVGCTVTALSSFISHVYNERIAPDVVNQKLKNVKAFDGALLYWARVPVAYPKLKWIKRAYNYSNLDVSYYVYVKKIPVMVEVNAAPIGAARHWVLYLGSKQMMDPWYGRIDTTSKYIPTGSAFYQLA
jgi:hypothetical protein